MVVTVQNSNINQIDFATVGGEIIGCADAGAAVPVASCSASTTTGGWTLKFSALGGVTLSLPPSNIPLGQPLSNGTNAFDLMLRNLVPGQSLSVTATPHVQSGTTPAAVTNVIEAVPPADRRVVAATP
jgi:undecaprenyl pyrophosphate phosphatase UppP